MSERPTPNIYEINDEHAAIHAEVEAVTAASEAERAERAAEATQVDPEMAEQRAASLGEARDAVMEAFAGSQTESATPAYMNYGDTRLKVSEIYADAGGRSWAILEDNTVGGGERHMMLPKVAAVSEAQPAEEKKSDAEPHVADVALESAPAVVLKKVISQQETHPAVVAAEEHLRAVQKEKGEKTPEEASSETEEQEPAASIIERVHDRLEHARGVIGNVEKGISSRLMDAERVLKRVEGYLDDFQKENRRSIKLLAMEDTVKEINFLVRKTADIVDGTHRAISAGTRVIDTPLRLLQELTDRKEEDTQMKALAAENTRRLQEFKAESPTSLKHEDLRDIDRNLVALQRSRLTQDEMRRLVKSTLQMIQAYNSERRQAENPDSPRKAQLKAIAEGLESYASARR